MKNAYSLPCNIAQTLNLIGDKWSLLILHRLLTGCGTYKELRESLDGIPSNLLSERLKTLEGDGLISSELYQEHPPRYRYSLTGQGADLEDVFNALVLWGEKHLPTCYKKLVHESCGHPVEHRYYCPHCRSMVDGGELGVREAAGPGAEGPAEPGKPGGKETEAHG